MRDDTIRIGLVGAGRNMKVRHIPGFRQIDGVELVSVANRTRESGQRVADEYNIPKVYDNWVDLIAAPDTNAICIGTWPYMHRAMVLAALEKDKHVLTEARMAMNAREAHDMLEASLKKPNLVTQVVPPPFVLHAEATIKEMIRDGYLGDILAVDLVYQSGFVNYDGPLFWRHDRDLSGFNIMLMGAFYETLMHLIGPATSVTAVTRVNVTSRLDSSGDRRIVTIPDHVEVICEMASGPITHIRISEVMGLATMHQISLYGSEGTLRLARGKSIEESQLLGGRRGDTELKEIELPPEKRGSWQVEENFVNAIRGIAPVTHTTFEDGVKYMEFIEAVTRSARSGKTVHLPF